MTPAFPKLAKDLNINPKNLGLLITAFTLPSLILGPIIGILADRLGRKIISSVFYAATGFAVLIFFVFRYCTCRKFVICLGSKSLLNPTIGDQPDDCD
ncbi:MFS transporter [Nostoc sp.]|uniref:MFS transporter n=1 Tax=Nostoc sp. TaxID=1180 RepID=UPI003FA554EF